MTYTDLNYENLDFTFPIAPKGQGAKCSADYNPIEYLSVGGASPRCVSLNSALKVSTGVMGPPTSRLCYKR